MATFDSLIEILSSRFGLGATARLLVSEIVAMISAPPGGLGGFLDKLKSAGLASEVASWLGHPDAAPLAAGQVERALGATALSGIASRMGLEQSIVTPALGYALPRIVGPFDAGRRCSSRRPRRDHGFSLTTASRGGGGAGRAEADRRSPDKRAKRARRRALAMARGRGHRRDWPAFVFLVGVQPNGARREGARACDPCASDRRAGAHPAAGSRASGASPAPAVTAQTTAPPVQPAPPPAAPAPSTDAQATGASPPPAPSTSAQQTASPRRCNQRTGDSSRSAGFACPARQRPPPRLRPQRPNRLQRRQLLQSSRRLSRTPPRPPPKPARFALSNDNGVVRASGVVPDEDAKTSIVDALNAVFGADKVKSDISVDPERHRRLVARQVPGRARSDQKRECRRDLPRRQDQRRRRRYGRRRARQASSRR